MLQKKIGSHGQVLVSLEPDFQDLTQEFLDRLISGVRLLQPTLPEILLEELLPQQ
jgi:chemotaxis regulatin CheY-phosphate phosphatase CheZ